MVKNIIVSGATSGFGEAIAKQFAQEGHQIWLTGRRRDRLEAIKSQLSKYTKVAIADFDIRNRQAVETFATEVKKDWGKVDILVNNAGLALGNESIDKGDPDDWDVMIDTNIKGLLYMSRAFASMMTKKQLGHIINIGSTAGKMAYENGNVYCATKFAVDALTQSMRIDLLSYGIKVTSINPGMAETEFSTVRYKGDQQKAQAVYEGFNPLLAQNVADIVSYCASLPENVCINDLTVTCLRQANSVYKNKEK